MKWPFGDLRELGSMLPSQIAFMFPWPAPWGKETTVPEEQSPPNALVKELATILFEIEEGKGIGEPLRTAGGKRYTFKSPEDDLGNFERKALCNSVILRLQKLKKAWA